MFEIPFVWFGIGLITGVVGTWGLVWIVGHAQLKSESNYLESNRQLIEDLTNLPQAEVMRKYGFNDAEYHNQLVAATRVLHSEVYG